MKEIKYNGKVYAVIDEIGSLDVTKEGTQWYGTPGDSIQAGRFWHKTGKKFRTHIHKQRTRSNDYTQEAIVVFFGKVKASILDENKKPLVDVVLNPGSIAIFYAGYHGFEVVQDALFFEIKPGPFVGVTEDKEFLE